MNNDQKLTSEQMQVCVRLRQMKLSGMAEALEGQFDGGVSRRLERNATQFLRDGYAVKPKYAIMNNETVLEYASTICS